MRRGTQGIFQGSTGLKKKKRRGRGEASGRLGRVGVGIGTGSHLCPSLLPLDLAMRRPDLRLGASLLLADLALLWLLQGPLGALLPLGLPGLWLEGALRLGGLWGLLRLGGLLEGVGALLPILCLVNPLFLSLRALVLGALSAPLVRVAAATWAWLLLGYGAVGLSRALWAVLSPPGAKAEGQGQENRVLMWRLLKLSWPDLPFLVAAFSFLSLAVLGEWGEGAGTWGLGGGLSAAAL